MRAIADTGVHLVCAAGPAGVAAGALLARAMRRANVFVAGMTVLSYGERVDSPAWRTWLSDTPALLFVGLGVTRPLYDDKPQLEIDAASGDPLAARAYRLAETLVHLGDSTWCAAVGLVDDDVPHVLVERALGRHSRDELRDIAELLDAGARGPDPASESLMALEMLSAALDPRRFVESVPGQLLKRTRALVRSELARASRIRPRPGFGAIVVEYESRCYLEDLVAARWRGLRPGTAVLVANWGGVDGVVSVTARAVIPEALDRLRATLGDNDHALLSPEAWDQLRTRLGVAPAIIERLGAAVGAPTLMN
ncbi:MAG: hypothetical protein JWN44_7053 [Myxococcales bacterium]|nr:hypothetical protein [Myxococcales bacterium]